MTMISRRSFLKGTGVAAAAAALTACGAASGAASTAASSAASGASSAAGDAALAEFDSAADALADWAGSYDAIINSVYVETDLAKRETLLHQAEDMLMSTWCLLPLYFYVNVYAQKEAVTGIVNTVFGMKYFMYSSNTANPKELNIYLGSDPDSMDPCLTSTVDSGTMMCNLFAGLMTNTADGVKEACAEKYEVSADSLSYTFTMRDGLKWSDGSELNAKDFVYSWNRAIDEKTGSSYAYLFSVIKTKDDGTLDVTASDDGKTLTVNLAGVTPYFLDLCAFPTFFPVPQKAVEAGNPDGSTPGGWALNANYVTNGAYTVTEWVQGSSITMEANPNFWDAANVTMPKLNHMLSSDPTAVWSAYQSGSLDMSSTVPTDELASLKSSNSPELHIDPYLGTYYTCFNVKSPLFSAMSAQQACAARKALCLAVDRDFIVEKIGQAGQKPANCFVSDGCSDGHGGKFRENNDGYEYPSKDALGYFDPEADNNDEILALLAAAGFTVKDDGTIDAATPFNFEYLVNNESDGNIKIGEAMQQDFTAYGITMTIKQEEFKSLVNDRKKGNYDVARNGWLMDYDDPINELEMWMSTSGNNDVQFGK